MELISSPEILPKAINAVKLQLLIHDWFGNVEDFVVSVIGDIALVILSRIDALASIFEQVSFCDGWMSP